MGEIENREVNYNYIKKLTIFFKKCSLEDLFTALVLNERYTLIDDIKILTKEEIKDAHKKYSLYLKSRQSLIDRRWL